MNANESAHEQSSSRRGLPEEPSDPSPPSIWLGSQHPVTTGHAKWLPGHDADLRALVEGQGRPLLVVARNSDAMGRKGCLAAAADAHDALFDLVSIAGLDVTHCVPSIEELAGWLFASPNKRKHTERSGRTFLVRSCLVDLSRHGIILSLSAGSSLKLDSEHQQPHVVWVQRVLHAISDPPAAGMFTKRWDRLSRSTALGVVHELKALEVEHGSVWSADAELGRMQHGDMAELVATARGMGGRAEGLAIRAKAVSGVRRLTDKEMVGGRAAYSHSAPAPPGLMRYKDRRTGRGVLALDTPALYPDRKDTLGGLPDVRDGAGDLVDQIENVRWFLKNYGRDGVDDRDIVDGLIARRYSTDGLRHRAIQGPAAYWGGPSRPKQGSMPSRWINPLLDKLEMYQTGRLVLPLGADDGAVITIEGIMPLDGPWGDAEDFVRINFHRHAMMSRQLPPPPSWSWSGFATSFDGAGATMAPSAASSGEFRWRFELASSKDGARPAATMAAPRIHRSIPDRVLFASLIECLVAANGRPMQRFVGDDAARERVATLTCERDRVASEVDSAEKQLKSRLDLIMAVDEEGVLAMPKAMHARAFADWERQRAVAVKREHELARLERELVALTGATSGISAAAMAAMVNALRDPSSSPYREELRRCVKGLRFWTEPLAEGRDVGTRLNFAGELVVSTSTGPFSVPFAGTHSHGPAASVQERRFQALAQLRGGTVARGVHEGSNQRYARGAANLLGLDPVRFSLSACGDSTLLRLAMAAVFPDPVPGEDPDLVPRLDDLLADPVLRAEFADPQALVDRIRTHYATSSAPGWLHTRQGPLETSLLLGDLNGLPDAVAREDRQRVGAFRYGRRQAGNAHIWEWRSWSFRPRPLPCRYCGGRLLAAVRFPEATGYLCMAPDCRRDAAGVRWPERFDQYISCVDLWLAAGVQLTLPEGFTGDARSMRGASVEPIVGPTGLRGLAELSDVDRAAIVDAYQNKPMTIREICTSFAVTRGVMYKVLRAEGAAPTGNRPRRPRALGR